MPCAYSWLVVYSSLVRPWHGRLAEEEVPSAWPGGPSVINGWLSADPGEHKWATGTQCGRTGYSQIGWRRQFPGPRLWQRHHCFIIHVLWLAASRRFWARFLVTWFTTWYMCCYNLQMPNRDVNGQILSPLLRDVIRAPDTGFRWEIGEVPSCQWD